MGLCKSKLAVGEMKYHQKNQFRSTNQLPAVHTYIRERNSIMGLCKSKLAVGELSNQQDSSTAAAPTSTSSLRTEQPSSSLTTLIGDDTRRYGKWSAFVDGKNGFFYGIPCNARRVVKFNPIDKSLTEIGPDLGDGGLKWMCGVLANTGSIYCAPYLADHILKINTNDGTVETLDDVELPETGHMLWASGALAHDNTIYYMPYRAHQIMKLNPDNDTLSSVGDDLGYGWFKYRKYGGTVVGKDYCLYGIPYDNTHIIKFDPTNSDTTHTVGEEAEFGFDCGNGVLAGDGYIYSVNSIGQVLKVDSTTNNYTWIGGDMYSGYGVGWGDPIVGADNCIYWLRAKPIVYSNLTPRHNNYHRSWGMTLVDSKGTNGMVEL
jgi:hypothetical protein